jgi:preprotein translocase subunit SecE
VQKKKIMSLTHFLKGSYHEFRNKVEWPKWMDLQSSTVVVSVTTLILSLFTFGVDEVFSKAIRNIIAFLINL